MLDTISFVVKANTTNHDNEGADSYVFLEVTPLINGAAIECALFDAATVLAQDTHAGYFEPFTCSCGTAGCAGIMEDAYLSVHDDIVQWRFPEQYFRTSLPAGLTIDRSPLTFNFSITNYKLALDALVEELQRFYVMLPRVTFFIGDNPDDDELETPLQEQLADIRERRLNWLRQTNLRNETFGDMSCASVYATLPEGSVFSVHLVSLADSLAYEEVAPSGEILGEARDAAFVRLGKELTVSKQSAIDMLKRLGPEFFTRQYSFEKASEAAAHMESNQVDDMLCSQWNQIEWSLDMGDYIAGPTQ